jgi:UDP-N-acetylglucosamine/UDP-N-acetylgalactosamine diphosphorylase
MKSTKQSSNKSLKQRDDVDKNASAVLAKIGNQQLIDHWNALDAKQKHHLFDQLARIDLPTLRLQQQMVHEPQIQNRSIEPFTSYSRSGNREDKRSGSEIIANGQAGCLIIAGGQGTRLHIDGPKGKCQITKIRKKSLFQLFAEKTLAAGKQVDRALPLAIMTSPLNHEETVAFFREHAFFGLDPKQVSFFQQGTLPLLDETGNLFLETNDSLSEGPDGNGSALQKFFQSGLWNDWQTKGIRYLNFVLVDNPLADPFDAEFFGFHKRMGNDISIKCIERSDPAEPVGVIVRENGKTAVVEYSELPDEQRKDLNPDKTLRHPLANLSLFCFNMEFIKKLSNIQPILHKAHKAVKFLDAKGKTVKADQPMAWKFETFIFDCLPFASKTAALVYPRQACFAPLKNFSGKDSFETVSEALEKSDQRMFSEATGAPCQITPFEISQEFYYPTPALQQKWKGKTVKAPGYYYP